MRTRFYDIHTIIDHKKMLNQDISPLPLEVIPNHMGINLCAVEGISFTKQKDGQLVSLTIHFLPDLEKPELEKCPHDERGWEPEVG